MNKFLSIILMLMSTSVFAVETINPKTVSEFKKTSVRILNLEKSSGGTGSIFRSYDNATHILTNKHICRLVEQGGIVDYNGKDYGVTHYKKFEQHDLCLIRIEANLNVNTEVADTIAKPSEKSIVSGHPNLLPHIVTIGHLSDKQDISLIVGVIKCTKEDIVGVIKCTKEDIEKDPLTCLMFGGAPVVKTLDAQLISNLIKPGNSGSAVFNKEGKIIGVVFAGSGRDFSYGYIVPQIYLLFFIQNAHRQDWTPVGTPVDEEGMSDRVFNFDKCSEVLSKTDKKFDKLKDFCKRVNDTMIWRK